MVFWSLYQNKSMEIIQRFCRPPGENGKAIYEKRNTSFTPSHSLFLPFSFIPQGKLVCYHAVDLLGDEKSPGCSAVTGLKWTLSAPNHIWRHALHLFLAPLPFLVFFLAVLWKTRPHSDSLTSEWTSREGVLTHRLLPRTNIRVDSSIHSWAETECKAIPKSSELPT